jgi:ubiquinone/menaquinone biosynthesis C-methylase UbiE
MKTFSDFRSNSELKSGVHDFWNTASCGESLFLDETSKAGFENQARQRYALEPYIVDFANFSDVAGARVLEIGVGLGAEHQKFAEAGAILHGVDLTERAIELTSLRLKLAGLESTLKVADAEHLPYGNSTFDVVYSWGVIHHSPDTESCVREIYRVLNAGGRASIMIYSKWSCIGIMLWLRYALFALKPWTSLETIYATYLESPGTKAYTKKQGYQLFSAFSSVTIETVLTHGDLLTSEAGQRHRGKLLKLARVLWPRWLISALFPRAGLFMLITARK